MDKCQPLDWATFDSDPPMLLACRGAEGKQFATRILRGSASRSSLRHNSLRNVREQVLTVLAGSKLEMVYQPALRLDEPKVAFFEALSRFQSPSAVGPADWFLSATAVGLGVELELLAAKSAVAGLPSLPNEAVISINISPATVLSPAFAAYVEALPLDKIVVELTEQEAVPCYDRLVSALAPLRKRGLKVAVDDAGAGHASFRHILHIRPDIIKLDTSLSRRVDEDPMRQALISALVTFSRQIGSELVAEGVESAGELECLRELGMLIIQGHIAARPMPLDAIGTAATRQSSNQVRRAHERLSQAA